MKLFYKKDYIRVSGDLVNLEKEYSKLEIRLQEEYKKRCLLEKQIIDLKTIITQHVNQINDLRGEIDHLSNKNIKLEEELGKVKKDLKTTQNKLKESMTDKYLVRKIPSGRTPTQKISHIQGMKSNVSRYMREKHDYE